MIFHKISFMKRKLRKKPKLSNEWKRNNSKKRKEMSKQIWIISQSLCFIDKLFLLEACSPNARNRLILFSENWVGFNRIFRSWIVIHCIRQHEKNIISIYNVRHKIRFERAQTKNAYGKIIFMNWFRCCWARTQPKRWRMEAIKKLENFFNKCQTICCR